MKQLHQSINIFLLTSWLSQFLHFPSTAAFYYGSTGNHINNIKARILMELGLSDPSVYDRYDIVWPQQDSLNRLKRDQFIPLHNKDALFIGMDLFNRRMSVYLEVKNITSPGFETVLLSAAGVPYVLSTTTDDLRCHYRGRAQICLGGVCTEGRAAISTCGNGMNGYLKVDGDDVQLRPLPASVWSNVREAMGAHLAKRLTPLEHWDELRELNIDHLDSTPSSSPPLFQSSNFITQLRDLYGFTNNRPLSIAPLNASPISEDIVPPNGSSRLLLEVAVFIDQTMATKLQQEYRKSEDQVNAVLAAFNAVQTIFDDDTFGQPKLRISVKRVVMDQTNKVFQGDGEAEAFLTDLCNYEDDLVKSLGGNKDWDILVALTGVDIYGVLDDVVKDPAYAGIKFPQNRVYGVTGLTFTGGACKANRNCVLVEFWKGMENVDTLAHEIGHSIGMSHDGTNNQCKSYGGNMMSLSTTVPRMGWSTCSTKSFHDFLQQGKGSCLTVDLTPDTPHPHLLAAMTNG